MSDNIITSLEVSKRNRNVFLENKCTRCGDCFHFCPHMELPQEIAIQEINALINRTESNYVLKHCSTCLSCNLICPNECNPYQLILENWNDMYCERGAPPIYKFVCPTIKRNIWQMLEVLMPKKEKKVVKQWLDQKPSGTALLVGNYTHILSFILSNSRILDYFTTVDRLDQWEIGAYLYQGGYLDVVKQIGKRSKEDFDKFGVKTIVPFLDAVHYMIDYIQPTEMGNRFDQKVMNFNEWLIEKIEQKEIILKNKLGFKVTVHDNCYSKANGDLYWNNARKIIELTSCTNIEMEHNKKFSLCCGFGAGASWVKNFSIPFDILYGTRRKFDEAEATGADALVTYCGGCMYLLWAGKVLFKSQLKIFHTIELVRLAMGEEIDVDQQKIHERRAWDIIAIITYHLIISSFAKTFKIEKITFDEQKRWENKKYLTLRFMRFLFRAPFVKWVYRKIFLLMLKKFKTPFKLPEDGDN